MSASADIHDFERGYSIILVEGIQPFIRLVENNKAKAIGNQKFIKVYDLIYKMCNQFHPFNWAKSLYVRYMECIHQYLVMTIMEQLRASQNGSDTTFLHAWTLVWHKHKIVVRGLSSMFMYLDRCYTADNTDICNLRQQGFRIYRQVVFSQFVDRARTAICNCIDRERDQEEQDRHLLNQSVSVFVELGYSLEGSGLKLYQNEFEAYLLARTATYYRTHVPKWVGSDSCCAYLERVDRLYVLERARVDAYLNRRTLVPLLKECYLQLLQAPQDILLGKKTGLFYLLTNSSIRELTQLYKSYAYNPQDLIPMARLTQEYLTREIYVVLHMEKEEDKREEDADQDAAHKAIRSLIDVHVRYSFILSECFGNSKIFGALMVEAFQTCVNKDHRVSKMLASFNGELLKKGNKMNVTDTDLMLDQCACLYGYLRDKDLFERDYQTLLSSRLLEGLSESEHAEKSAIAKLKRASGYHWTHKLEGMFKDMHHSKELMAKFAPLYTLDPQVDVRVCTTGYWPNSKPIPASVPSDLSPLCEAYNRFYVGLHSGHKLQWYLGIGHAEVNVQFSPSVKRTLVVTTYQMMILLLFNHHTSLTFRQLLDMTGVSVSEISNHVLSLAHPKVRVLCKYPNTRKLEDTHEFTLNDKYSSVLKKVSIPLLQMMSRTPVQKDTKAIDMQRRHQIEAMIVRIMKARKTLRYNQLVSEVILQLQSRFAPRISDIKQRLEALMSHDYLERDSEDPSVYHYMA